MTGQECKHRACRFLLASAQVECYCHHTKEQHRRDGRHACEGQDGNAKRVARTGRRVCPCLAYAPPSPWMRGSSRT